MENAVRTQHSKFRQFIQLITLIGLLGLVSTIGVAWFCGIFLNPVAGTMKSVAQPSGDPDVEWRYAIHQRSGACCVFLGLVRMNERGKFKGMSVALPDPPDVVPVWGDHWPNRDPYYWTQDARGWPWLSMWSRYIVAGVGGFPDLEPDIRSDRYVAYTHRSWAVRLNRTAGGFPTVQMIPFGIIWRGFILNWLFYAACWTALFGSHFAIRATKRWRRQRAGRCIECGYMLADARRCPECGHVAHATA